MTPHEDKTLAARRDLIATIEREVRWGGIGDGSDRLEPRVLDALRRVPRERFVPPDLAAHAYDNRPLPIGHHQTISQPLVVAVMTHLLHLEPASRVLEVGTGSGYQTALLAELAGEVVTIEVVEPLAREARAKLEALGYRNIVFEIGDGAAGFSLMDVDTLVRHGLPVVMVMGNNSAWGLEKGPMQMLYGYDVAADLAPRTAYDEVVKALGGAGETVTDPRQIGPALDRAFASGVPYLVNVITDVDAAYPRATFGI